MPLGPSSLNTMRVLEKLSVAIRLEPTSPTGLAWCDNYAAIRAAPGQPAGRWSENHKSFIVTANGVPLHCRHAVWMLAHGTPIPEGDDVFFLDGSESNLAPENLDLRPIQRFRNLKAAWKPTALRVPSAYTVMPVPHCELLQLIVHLNKRQFPILVGVSRAYLLMAAYCVAAENGIIPTLPALPIPVEVQTYIRSLARVLCPNVAKPTDRENEAARQYRLLLSADLPQLAAALTAAKAPRAAATVPKPASSAKVGEGNAVVSLVGMAPLGGGGGGSVDASSGRAVDGAGAGAGAALDPSGYLGGRDPLETL
jgi:hypothetical protein